MRRLVACSFVSLLVLLVASAAQAQITGAISGVVRDDTGAALPDATITVKGDRLPVGGRTATSGANGAYRLPLLPPGLYDIEVAKQGFRSAVKKSVEVALDADTRMDFKLGAGLEEAVEVVAEVPLVDERKSEVSTRITQQAIDALPLNGREFKDLVRIVPGATPTNGESSTQSLDQISIFGERAAALSFLVDGADNNDPLNGGPFVRYTQDSIKEFEVITTGYEAQYGRAQGGVTNIITRSGANDFTGSAFLFLRNDSLDASNVPNQEPPKLERYQWGASVGGPIVREKAFFFGTFEKLNETRGFNIDRSKVPTFIAEGKATPGGVEDFGIAPTTDRLNGMVKLDFNLGQNQRLFVQGNRSNQDLGGEVSSPVAGTLALPSTASAVEQTANAGIARHTALLKPSLFLESSASWIKGRLGNNLDREGRFEPILVLLASGFMQTGAPFNGKTDRTTNRFQLAQALTWNKANWGGDHEFKFGWDWNDVSVKGFNNVVNDAEYSAAFLAPNAIALNEDAFTRLGFQQSAARFFLALPAPGQNLDVDITDHNWGTYVQDNWKMRHGVTLNLGVRYDYSGLFGEDKTNFGPRVGGTWDVGEKGKTIVRANWGKFYDRNLLTAAAQVPEKGGIFALNAFDVVLPRLGSDYTDSLIDLVITSGFPVGPGVRSPAENPIYTPFATDLRNDPLSLYKLLGIAVPNPSVPPVVTADNIQQLSGLTPAQAIAKIEAKYPGTDFEFFDVPGGSIVGNRVLSFFPRGPLGVTRDISTYTGDMTPVTNAFSIGMEQEFLKDFAVSATYVHRRSHDLLTRRIVNLYDVPQGNPNFGKTTDGGPRNNEFTYDGHIDYDGVAVAVRKRYAHGYAFLVSYTYSHNYDNLLTGQVGSGFANNNHPEIDWGPSNQSVPNNLVVSGLVDLPWKLKLSAIYTIRSGSAFNPRGIKDLDGDGLVDQRDTTQPRNAFRTKAYKSLDARLQKSFRIAGVHELSALIEGFNLFNTNNVESVTDVAGANFGTPTTYFPGRELQFGVMYRFGK
jgi:hypothetical protein